MNIFTTTFYGNSVYEWLVAAGVFIGSLLVLAAVRMIVVRRLSKRGGSEPGSVRGLVLTLLRRTKLFCLAIIALACAAPTLSLNAHASRIVDIIVTIGLLLQVALWGQHIIAFLLHRYVKSGEDETGSAVSSSTVFGYIGRVLLWTLVLLLMLDNVGVNITALVAGLGVGGIAIALALQAILSDVFSSLSILVDKPFVVGDYIVVDTYMGTIEHIGWKTTRVRSLSGEQLIFPNSDLLKSRIRNFQRMSERRVVFAVNVPYETDPGSLAKIPGIVRTLIEEEAQTRFDRAHFKEFGQYALVFEAVYFVVAPDYNLMMDIQERINLGIVRAFGVEGIPFAYLKLP